MPKKKPPKSKTRKPKSSKAAPKGAKVGKGKPPEHTRFQKGKSGNYGGRPKGSKNLATIIKEAADRPVVATIDGKQRKISTVMAAAMQLGAKAVVGDSKAIGKFLDWVDEIEKRAAAAKPIEFPFTPLDLEVMREIYDRMKLCKPAETAQ